MGRIRSESGEIYFKMRPILFKNFDFNIPTASAVKLQAIP